MKSFDFAMESKVRWLAQEPKDITEARGAFWAVIFRRGHLVLSCASVILPPRVMLSLLFSWS